MRNAIFPFLTVPDELVQISPWKVELSTGVEIDDPEFIPDWDNGTDIKLRRSVSLNVSDVIKALGFIHGQAELELVVVVGTGAGPIPSGKWVAYRQPLVEESLPEQIDLLQSADSLAEALHIETSIVLADCVSDEDSPLTPKHRGSIVWQERKRIRIEGHVSRFPVSETDLGVLLGNEWCDALWYLQVDWSDPCSEFDSAVRLHVNSGKEQFASRFRNADLHTLQTVMADVMSQICATALTMNEEWGAIPSESTDGSTLGEVAAHWLEQAFGSTEAGRQILSNAPGRFNACLNALATQPEGSK